MDIVIVDDSRLARKELVSLLKEHPHLQVVGEAGDVATALSLVNRLQPDLLLLDIHLPDGSGFDLLEQLVHTPRVIFTTAFEQHALQAFEVDALDYLLKPVTAARLAQALRRIDHEAAPARSGGEPRASRDASTHFFIRDGERCHFIRYHEIRLLEVEGNYVRLYFRDTHALLAKSLSQVEEKLDPALFFRASRRHIVNLDCIEHVEPWIGDGLMVRLRDGREIEVSRRQARELKQRLAL